MVGFLLVEVWLHGGSLRTSAAGGVVMLGLE